MRLPRRLMYVFCFYYTTLHHKILTGNQLRYTIPRFVQELQWGGGVLLTHWFYYRRNLNPLEMAGNSRSKTLLSDLTDEQFGFMVESYRTMGTMCAFI